MRDSVVLDPWGELRRYDGGTTAVDDCRIAVVILLSLKSLTGRTSIIARMIVVYLTLRPKRLDRMPFTAWRIVIALARLLCRWRQRRSGLVRCLSNSIRLNRGLGKKGF